jgi:hypothetical protein
MGVPVIFAGKKSKLLSSEGLLTSVGRTIDYDGPLNYIANPNAEVNTIGWATYADAAGVAPVDGTGGSPASTFTRSTTTPLRGSASFLWTKSAVNRQGEGFSYDFTIDSSDTGKVIQASLEYKIASGTFVDDDMQFWVYDKTNLVLIPLTPFKMKNSSLIEKFGMEFQTSYNSTSYRLICHTSSASTSAYSIQFDNWNVGPQAKLYGSPITDFITGGTVTFTATTTNPTKGATTIDKMDYRKVGDCYQYTFDYAHTTAGSAGSGTYSIVLPYSIDLTKHPVGSAAGFVNMNAIPSVSYSFIGYFTVASATSLNLNVMFNDSTGAQGIYALVSSSYVQLSNANFRLKGEVTLKSLGLSSSQLMSSDASTRLITAKATFSATQALSSSFPKLTGWVSNWDRAGMIDTTNNRFNILVPGDYKIGISAYVVSPAGALVFAYRVNGGSSIYLTEDGVTPRKNGYVLAPNLKAGDYVEIFGYAGSSGTLQNDVNCFVTIEQASGPAQIAASETVSALYTGNPPTGTINTSYNTVTFGTKVKDSHGAYASGVFTAPISGTYSVSAMTRQNATYAVGNIAAMAIAINGTTTYVTPTTAAASQTILYPTINIHSIPLLAGQTLEIRTSNNGTTPTFTADASVNYFSITRVGNY